MPAHEPRAWPSAHHSAVRATPSTHRRRRGVDSAHDTVLDRARQCRIARAPTSAWSRLHTDQPRQPAAARRTDERSARLHALATPSIARLIAARSPNRSHQPHTRTAECATDRQSWRAGSRGRRHRRA